MFAPMNLFLKNNSIPISFLIINILLKSLFLTSQSISLDEPFTIYHAQFDFWNLIGYLKNYNNPPLFEILLHFWIKLFGITEVSVRILPMLFSSFSVLFIYKIGKVFFDIKTAIVSSILFTFSNIQLFYAHDCRVYSLFLLLTVVSFYYFFKLLKDGSLPIICLITYILSNILIVYAHYFGFFIWGLESLIIVLYYRKNLQVTILFVKVFLFSILCYAPYILILYQRFFESAKNGTYLEVPNGFESIYNMIWSFTNTPVVTVITLIIITSCLVKFFFFTQKQIINPYAKYVIIWFTVPFIFMFIVSYKVPMFVDRYLIYITPALYLILALGIAFLFPQKKLYQVMSFLLVSSFLFSSNLNPDKKRLVKDTVNYIKSNKNNKTIVLVCCTSFNTTFAYYYNQKYFQEIDQTSEYQKLENLLRKDNIYFINHLDTNIINKIDQYEEIIYLDAGADFAMPNNNIKIDLLNKFKLRKEKFYFEIFNIYTFSKK